MDLLGSCRGAFYLIVHMNILGLCQGALLLLDLWTLGLVSRNILFAWFNCGPFKLVLTRTSFVDLLGSFVE